MCRLAASLGPPGDSEPRGLCFEILAAMFRTIGKACEFVWRERICGWIVVEFGMR